MPTTPDRPAPIQARQSPRLAKQTEDRFQQWVHEATCRHETVAAWQLRVQSFLACKVLLVMYEKYRTMDQRGRDQEMGLEYFKLVEAEEIPSGKDMQR